MRPYLAIIKDSFRAALASRVLYVLLGLILLFLLLISPLHVRESLDTRINLDRDVVAKDQMVLIDRLKEEVANENKGMQRIWEFLSDKTKEKLEKIEFGDEKESKTSDVEVQFATLALAKELNDMIGNEDFYREEDWKDAKLSTEARGYLNKGYEDLTEKQQKRLNRILVSESFGGMIRSGAASSLDIFYGPFDWSAYLSGLFVTNMSHDQFASQVSALLTWFLDKVVLSIGLLIAILVTANVVPQTFEPGTLNLLLSKPMSRTALFLAKFFGGCMFIALCASLLFVGLWLWMGLGLRVWERSVLISIPLYIVVFAIYYSVSAFTGLVTRSTILAIVATGLFWVLCWSVGTAYIFFSSQIKAYEIVRLTDTETGVVMTDPGHEPLEWEDSSNEWVESKAPELDQKDKIQKMVFRYVRKGAPFPDTFGPIYLRSAKKTAFSRLLVEDPRTHRKQQFFISEDGKPFERRGSLPSGTTALSATSKSLICVNRRGRIYRYDPQLDIDETEGSNDKTWFVAAGPKEKVNAREQEHIAINFNSEEIAIYGSGTVTVYEVDESSENRDYKKKISAKVELGTRSDMTCQIAFQGQTIVLALGNGQVILLDSQTLEKKNEFLPETRVAVGSLSGSEDGKFFSLLYRDNTLKVIDVDQERVFSPAVGGQGGISAVHFSGDDVLVADRTDRVSRYSLADFSKGSVFSPSGTWMQKTWRYGIKPLYFAFPKPGEFYKVVSHLSSSNDSQHNPDVDLTLQDPRPNPWSPLISGLVFMGVMLGISCLVFSRTDY